MNVQKSRFRRGENRLIQTVPEGAGMDSEAEDLLFNVDNDSTPISVETSNAPVQRPANSTDTDGHGG